MIVEDKIYGKEIIEDKVIIELLNSPTVKRLKSISQQGLPQEYYHRRVFSRFDHSLGVMILLRRLGAKLEEQIAGLLHDVSHTAFSHVVDWVAGDPLKEDYQDRIFADFLKNSEIPEVLDKHGFNVLDILDLSRFTLLEKKAPSLCADRVDYTLRELINLTSFNEVSFMASSLSNLSGSIVFRSVDAAKMFGEYYSMLQRKFWSGKQEMAKYYILAEALGLAISLGHISFRDLHIKTDMEIVRALRSSGNKEIVYMLDKLRKEIVAIEAPDGEIVLRTKFRYVDPEVYIDGKILHLSEISSDYKRLVEREKDNSGRGVRVKII